MSDRIPPEIEDRVVEAMGTAGPADWLSPTAIEAKIDPPLDRPIVTVLRSLLFQDFVERQRVGIHIPGIPGHVYRLTQTGRDILDERTIPNTVSVVRRNKR